MKWAPSSAVHEGCHVSHYAVCHTVAEQGWSWACCGNMLVGKMSKAECKYLATCKELLAVVSFLKYLKHFLLGRHFVVRMDHTALQWLWKTPDPMVQQARWISFLKEFHFDVVHRPGRQHVSTDALSRILCRSDEDSCRTIVQASCSQSAMGHRVTQNAEDRTWASRRMLGEMNLVPVVVIPSVHAIAVYAVTMCSSMSRHKPL